MKHMIFIGLSVLALVGLTGCASNGSPQGVIATTQVMDSTDRVRTQKFSCDNGIAPTIQYVDDEHIVLTVDNVRASFNIAPSGSGERYVGTSGVFGTGGEWHESAGEAVFTYKDVAGKDTLARCKAK